MLRWLRFCLALSLLLFPLSAALAGSDEKEPAIVLKLPSSMTAEEVGKLLGDLRAKGATAAPSNSAKPLAEPALVPQIWANLRRALPKTPSLLNLPEAWRSALAADGGSDEGFWFELCGVLAAALAAELSVRTALPHLAHRLKIPAGLPLRSAFFRHVVCLAAGLASFTLIARLGAGLVVQNSALLTATVAHLVDSAVGWRAANAFLLLFVAPTTAPARPLHLDDPGARRVARWTGLYLICTAVLVPAIWLVGRIAPDPDLMIDLAIGLGLIITLYKTVMFLRIRKPVSSAILIAGGERPGAARRLAAALWHWSFIAFSFVVFFLALEQYATGNGANTSSAASALQTVVVGMSLAWAAKQRFIHDYCLHAPAPWWRPVLNRAVDLTVLFCGLVWLARLWGFDLLDPDAAGIAVRVLRPIFRAAATLAVAWLVWTAIDGFLRAHRPHDGAPGDEDAPGESGMTRLATLLPLIRNMLAIAIFFLGTIIALGDLGVDIGPLLAGAGVVGIALGFGAQALVRDVIAGLFFLIDDAFRLGEYIDTGRLKGTVEAISIRSLRLRHQSGLVHTIPFGQILAVTNSSRDWAIIKFNLHIAPDSDLEVVRKTLKQLGLALLDDPEIGSDFIQPLKMQGVVDVTQGAIMIRCKFTARPVRPSYLRRLAMRGIIQRFAANGIAFAAPPAIASNPL